jgi:hypothetical protein
MAPLLNPRHEQFAQARARGAPASVAYAEAGYECNSADSVKAGAWRLGQDPAVVERIADLMALAARRMVLTIEHIEAMLMEERMLARQLGQVSAAIRALELLGKQRGMFVDRKKVEVTPFDGLDATLDAIAQAAADEADRRAGDADADDADSEPSEGRRRAYVN